MNHIGWALLGMVGYSATTLFVKLATRSGELAGFKVLAIAVSVVIVCVWAVAIAQGGLTAGAWSGFRGRNAVFALSAGVALAIAVISLFRALATGPASVVVPIYGMFIVGGSLLGVLVLGEPLTIRKAAGLALAVAGVVLIAR